MAIGEMKDGEEAVSISESVVEVLKSMAYHFRSQMIETSDTKVQLPPSSVQTSEDHDQNNTRESGFLTDEDFEKNNDDVLPSLVDRRNNYVIRKAERDVGLKGYGCFNWFQRAEENDEQSMKLKRRWVPNSQTLETLGHDEQPFMVQKWLGSLKERVLTRFFQETHRYGGKEQGSIRPLRKPFGKLSDGLEIQDEQNRNIGLNFRWNLGYSKESKSLLFILLTMFSMFGCNQAAPISYKEDQLETLNAHSLGSSRLLTWSDKHNMHEPTKNDQEQFIDQYSQGHLYKQDFTGAKQFSFVIMLTVAEVLFWIIVTIYKTRHANKAEYDPMRERIDKMITERYSCLKFQYVIGQIGNCIFWFMARQQGDEFIDETAGTLVIVGVSFFSKLYIMVFKYSLAITQDQKTKKTQIADQERDDEPLKDVESTLNRVTPVLQVPKRDEDCKYVSKCNHINQSISGSETVWFNEQKLDRGDLECNEPLSHDSGTNSVHHMSICGTDEVDFTVDYSQRQENIISNTTRKCITEPYAVIKDIEEDGDLDFSSVDSGIDSVDCGSDTADEDTSHMSKYPHHVDESVTDNSSFVVRNDSENDSLHIELSKHEPFCGNSLPLSTPDEIVDDARVPEEEKAEEKVLLEKEIMPFMKKKKKENIRIKVIQTELSLSVERRSLRKDSRAIFLEGVFHSLPVRESRTSEKRKIDAVCEKKDFIRSVWGICDVLPVPKIEITVAFKQAAEVQVQSKSATQQAVNPNFEPLDDILKKIADDQAPGPQITMRYELLRICTLRNYPKDNKPWLTQLAAAGFYYAAEGDEVICYCCGLRRHSWVSTDVPERVHQRINPNCKFLNRNSEFNVPIQYEGTTPNMEKLEALLTLLQEEEIPASIKNGAEGGSDVSEYTVPTRKSSNELKSPKHPQYVSKQQRITSFDGWPDNLTQTPEIMAEAGFYFAGFGDCVRCYYCGIGLRHWTKEDNPWIEHARWSQHCAFVKQVKGQEFINLVQMAVQVSQNNENEESAASSNSTGESSERSQSDQDEVENILRTDPAQSVLDMGYQPKVIKKAIDFILKREGKSGISSQKIMEKVLEYEEAESTQDLLGELAHMDLNRQDSATGGPASRDSVKSGETREKPATTSMSGEKNCKPKHSHHSGEMGRSNKDPNRPTAKDIKEENHRLKEQTLCKVCLDNTVCIVFLPCGHLCTCDDCAPAMRTCPICRHDVKGTVKTYMS